MSRAIQINWRQAAYRVFNFVNNYKFAGRLDSPANLGEERVVPVFDGPIPIESSLCLGSGIPLAGENWLLGDISTPLVESFLPAEPLMPLDYPLAPAKTGVWKEQDKESPPAKALPQKRVLALPPAGQTGVEVDHASDSQRADNLDNLLSYLKAKGFAVKEVKSITEETTRITLDDYLGRREAREPELVRVR